MWKPRNESQKTNDQHLVEGNPEEVCLVCTQTNREIMNRTLRKRGPCYSPLSLNSEILISAYK